MGSELPHLTHQDKAAGPAGAGRPLRADSQEGPQPGSNRSRWLRRSARGACDHRGTESSCRQLMSNSLPSGSFIATAYWSIPSWCRTRTIVAPRSAQGSVPVVGWDPPRRIWFGAAEEVPGRAHDIQVAQGVAGGSIVHLIDGVDDAEASATSRGWDIMLRRLREQATRPG
jgi:hypothetical protein